MKCNWNENWFFTKKEELAENYKVRDIEQWEPVNLPHTWNGLDGQDGGSDYYRGTCYYTKKLRKSELQEGMQTYIEFEGVNSSADVYVNGKLAVHHDGGYSTFRVNITELLAAAFERGEETAEILVAADNSSSTKVYPQVADFTFYGGIYRNVNIISVPQAHFDLDYHGGPGVMVTTTVEKDSVRTGEDGKVYGDTKVAVKAFFSGLTGGEEVTFRITAEDKIKAEDNVNVDGNTGAENNIVTEKTMPAAVLDAEAEIEFQLDSTHLWNGRKDPYLYTLEAVLTKDGLELDSRIIRFGCRYYHIDPDKGFFLNGKSYPLRGVSRHQDRPGIGNALLPKHHIEDMDLICEVGATTIRLAHYQHDQFFYDLCDERGQIIWAEIPYISQHMPDGRENTISQMRELIVQNYNHPSIVVWGLSNEITMQGADDPDLVENHEILNKLVHELDRTRLTTMAIVSMCPVKSKYISIPDTVSWNHYFGWYGGDTSMNGPWMDKFHAEYPELPVGVSEYGCEALNWHTSNPEQGDYTEEYQAYYHEELIKQLFTRPYLWATHVWNMFDFAADARSEGGEDGMNHKGLMTFDRKYKKDSFYAYKAWLSDEPFVHICGKRYVDRVEDVTKVTVYSNQPQVELLANGVSLGKQTSDVHFFYFQVPNVGETELIAKAGECTDSSKIVKVAEFNDAYRMKETGEVLNWFEITAPEGYLSINDKLSEVLSHPRAWIPFAGLALSLIKGNKAASGNAEKTADDGNAAKNSAAKSQEKKSSGKKSGGFNVVGMLKNKDMRDFIGSFAVKRIFSMMGTAGVKNTLTKEQMLTFNQKLNKIKK